MSFDVGDRVRVLSHPWADAYGFTGSVGTITGGPNRRMSEKAVFWSDKVSFFDVQVDQFTQNHEPYDTVVGQVLSVRADCLAHLSPLEQLADCAD